MLNPLRSLLPSFRHWLFVLVAFAALGAARPALADGATPAPAKSIVVVEIAASAAELDAPKLRAAIGDELGMDAVAPDDPRAASARGTISVAIDRDANKLVVSYRSQAAPITRDVALPPDNAGAVRAAVVLAGNLARDEASDLAEELRKRAKPAPPAPKATATWDASELRIDTARLDATLAYYADKDRRERHAVGWVAVSLGAIGIGVGIYTGTHASSGDTALAIGGAGGVVLISGIVAFATTSPMEDLWDARRGDETAAATEERWAKLAVGHQGARRRFATYMLIAGGVFAVLGTLELAFAKSDGDRFSGAFNVVGAVGFLSVGIDTLVSDDPIERSWIDYQRATGRAPAASLTMPRFGVSPVRGGAVAGFNGTF